MYSGRCGIGFICSRRSIDTTVANLENRMITVVDTEILSQTLAGMDKIGEYVEAQLAQEK